MERKVKHDAKFIDKNCLSSNEINQIKVIFSGLSFGYIVVW